MRIVDLKVWVINAPLTVAFQSSFERRSGTTRTVIRMETDTGLVGWGETFRGDPTARVIELYRDKIVGRSVTELGQLRAELRMTPFFYGYIGYAAIAGIEMAYFDLLGKAAGLSLADLLGGSVRDRVALTGLVTRGLVAAEGEKASPDAIGAAAKELVDQWGFGTVKLKGSVDAVNDVELVGAIRRSMPEIGLRIDPNAAWSVSDSIAAARRLEEYGLEYLEDPCAGLEGMARVRASTSIPLCTNMCVVRLEEVAPAIRLGAVDVIHGDVHKWGGIDATRRLAALCDGFGLGMNLHSGGELGISTACHLQVTAAMPEINYAIDSMYYLVADDIITEPFVVDGGSVAVPGGPGIGVTVDEEKLDNLAKLHDVEGDIVR
jgi:glucarate dehydratase